jgi:hypothetical protein
MGKNAKKAYLEAIRWRYQKWFGLFEQFFLIYK